MCDAKLQKIGQKISNFRFSDFSFLKFIGCWVYHVLPVKRKHQVISLLIFCYEYAQILSGSC